MKEYLIRGRTGPRETHTSPLPRNSCRGNQQRRIPLLNIFPEAKHMTRAFLGRRQKSGRCAASPGMPQTPGGTRRISADAPVYGRVCGDAPAHSSLNHSPKLGKGHAPRNRAASPEMRRLHRFSDWRVSGRCGPRMAHRVSQMGGRMSGDGERGRISFEVRQFFGRISDACPGDAPEMTQRWEMRQLKDSGNGRICKRNHSNA